jgi:hypothetical protein
MASDIGLYNDIRGHSLVDWRVARSASPREEWEMLVCHRPGTDTSQLFRLQHERGDLLPVTGDLLPVTGGAVDAVSCGAYEPIHGNFIVFERARGGSEEV